MKKTIMTALSLSTLALAALPVFAQDSATKPATEAPKADVVTGTFVEPTDTKETNVVVIENKDGSKTLVEKADNGKFNSEEAKELNGVIATKPATEAPTILTNDSETAKAEDFAKDAQGATVARQDDAVVASQKPAKVAAATTPVGTKTLPKTSAAR